MSKWIILPVCLLQMCLSTTVEAESGRTWADRTEMSGMFGFDLTTHAGPGQNNEAVSASYKLGYSAGVGFGIRWTDIVATQLELSFTRKGAHVDISDMDFGTFEMSYLEVPLLARVALPLRKRFTPYASLGAALGVHLGTNVERADGGNDDVTQSIKNIDVGIMVGAGVGVDITPKGSIIVDLRYNFGLRNWSKISAPEDDEVMNRAFYFMAGYRTSLGFL